MSMRDLLIVFTALLSATLDAQRARPIPSVPPPVVFPFPPLMQPPAGGLNQGSPFQPPAPPGAARDLFRVGSGDRARWPRHPPFGLGYNGGMAYSIGSPAEPAPTPATPVTGLFRLSVTPLTAHVLVDGYDVGSAGDIEAQHGLTLDAGPHRIEIRAPGYDTVIVNVQIAPFATIGYHVALEPVRPPASAARPAAFREPMYMIPRCYLGNVPPRADRLPPGCRIVDAQVVNSK